jgi:hypothetical protein
MRIRDTRTLKCITINHPREYEIRSLGWFSQCGGRNEMNGKTKSKEPVVWVVAEEKSQRSKGKTGAAIVLVLLVLVVLASAVINDQTEDVVVANSVVTTVPLEPNAVIGISESVEVSMQEPVIDSSFAIDKPDSQIPAVGQLSSIEIIDIPYDTIVLQIHPQVTEMHVSFLYGLNPGQVENSVQQHVYGIVFAMSNISPDQPREAFLDSVAYHADWLKQAAAADSYAGAQREEVFNAYYTLALENLQPENYYWLANYVTVMSLIADSYEEQAISEQLVVRALDIRAELEEAVQRAHSEQLQAAQAVQEESVPAENTQSSWTPNVIIAEHPASAPAPQPSPITVRDPSSLPPEAFVFGEVAYGAPQTNIPPVVLDPGLVGFGLGFSVEQTVRSIQRLTDLLIASSYGREERWVVFSTSEIPLILGASAHSVVFVREDSLYSRWEQMPLACAQYLKDSIEGSNILSPELQALGRVECSKFHLNHFLEPAEGKTFTGPHYDENGRVDFLTTTWLSSNSPVKTGDVVYVSDISDLVASFINK